MKKLLVVVFLLFAIASSCPGQVIVYGMSFVENTFDLDNPCTGKYFQAAGGFVAIDVDINELAALECGESMWTSDTAMVKFGQANGFRWRCEEEPLVRIYRLADNQLSVSVESFDINESTDNSVFEMLADVNDPNDPNEIPIPDPNEPNEPDKIDPGEPELNGTVTDCFNCYLFGNEPDKPINLGRFVRAEVPRVFSGRCIYNGERIRGSSKCVLWLNPYWSFLANNSVYSPAEIREIFCDRRLFTFTPVGTCCNPDPLPAFEEPY